MSFYSNSFVVASNDNDSNEEIQILYFLVWTIVNSLGVSEPIVQARVA